MKNYAEMTDDQINDAVAIARGTLIRKGKALSLYQVEGADLCTDFCNSWSDAGSIIQNSQISLDAIYEGGPRWLSFAGDDGEFRHTDANPLRAAMIVFLMMRENDKP